MIAALAAALALWAAWTCADRRLLGRLAARPYEAEVATQVRGRRGLVALCVLGLVMVGGLVDGRRGGTLAAVVGLGAVTAWLLWRRGRERAQAAAARLHVVDAGEALGGLLGVGAIPSAALGMVASDHPVLAQAAAELEIGGDIVAGFRRESTLPGREGLRDLAAAWEVAARTGASLRGSVDAIADDLRRRQESQATVRVELAASRSAGRLLAGLPVVGVFLGYGFGGDPMRFLTTELLGQACLVAAVALACGGLLWTDALADRGMR